MNHEKKLKNEARLNALLAKRKRRAKRRAVLKAARVDPPNKQGIYPMKPPRKKGAAKLRDAKQAWLNSMQKAKKGERVRGSDGMLVLRGTSHRRETQCPRKQAVYGRLLNHA